jgi:hypothetical protein
MRIAGMLEDRTDPNALARKSFVRLPGVDDTWLSAVKVDDEADEALLERPKFAALMKMMEVSPLPGCCRGAIY